MKKFLLSIALCAVVLSVDAQSLKQNNSGTRLFELEAGVGTGIGSGRLGPYSRSPHSGIYFFIEPRLNIPGSSFDVGVQLSVGRSSDHPNPSAPDYYYSAKYNPAVVTFVDYNLRKWRNVSLFGGAGMGVSAIDLLYPTYPEELGGRVERDVSSLSTFVFNPRIGVEFWDHLRVTMEYKWIKREYSIFGVTVGGIFGGGYKKRNK